MPTGMYILWKIIGKIPQKVFTNLSFWKSNTLKDLVPWFFDFLCKAKYFKRADPQNEIVSYNAIFFMCIWEGINSLLSAHCIILCRVFNNHNLNLYKNMLCCVVMIKRATFPGAVSFIHFSKTAIILKITWLKYYYCYHFNLFRCIYWRKALS
jgi:hypothetical protein